jgi:hypothetical protein
MLFESFPLPANDRFRLNEYQRVLPICPNSGKDVPQHPIHGPDLRALYRPLEHAKLMTKCKIFNLQRRSRLYDRAGNGEA